MRFDQSPRRYQPPSYDCRPIKGCSQRARWSRHFRRLTTNRKPARPSVEQLSSTAPTQRFHCNAPTEESQKQSQPRPPCHVVKCRSFLSPQAVVRNEEIQVPFRKRQVRTEQDTRFYLVPSHGWPPDRWWCCRFLADLRGFERGSSDRSTATERCTDYLRLLIKPSLSTLR